LQWAHGRTAEEVNYNSLLALLQQTHAKVDAAAFLT
jgi:hypothetical protein